MTWAWRDRLCCLPAAEHDDELYMAHAREVNARCLRRLSRARIDALISTCAARGSDGLEGSRADANGNDLISMTRHRQIAISCRYYKWL